MTRKSAIFFLSLILFIHNNLYGEEKEKGETMELKSDAFTEGETIPELHTCDGPDLSPAFSWSGAPEGTGSFALICDDPDAPMGIWVHWVVYDIPASENSLPEGLNADPHLPSGGKQGVNDFRRYGFGGPCPPKGKPHRYFFKLYALDNSLDLEPGASKSDVEKAMKGHVLAEASLMGRYGR